MYKRSKTPVEQAHEQVERFVWLQEKLSQSIAIKGKVASTLSNYLPCLPHLALYFQQSPEKL